MGTFGTVKAWFGTSEYGVRQLHGKMGKGSLPDPKQGEVMPLRLMCLAAVLFAPLAGAESKTITVPVDYPTIKAAIEAAAPGDTVLIKPGQYQESLVIDKAVTVKGEAAEQVRLHNSVMASNVIKVTSKETVQLENLIVEHTDEEPDPKSLKYPSLVWVEGGGKAEIRRCVLRKGGGCGLLVGDDSFALAENCRMEQNAQAGAAVCGKNARGRFVKNTMSENPWGGISVFDGGAGEFLENSLTKNQRNGILIFGPGPEGVLIQGNRAEGNAYSGIQVEQRKGVVIEANIAVKNAENGIRIQTGAQTTVKRNTCEDNSGPGLHVAGVLTEAVLEENTCTRNRGAGILVHAGTQTQVRGNTASENSTSGIIIRNWNTSAEITANICAKNKAHGVLAALGATASVAGNTCSDNEGRGVAATDEGTAATIGTNTLENNADRIPLKDTPLSRQSQVENFHIGWALAAGQFDYLEGIVARIRVNKCRNAQGKWELETFYDALRNGYWSQTWRQKEPFVASVQKWCEQKPQSVSARIVMIETYKNYAWQARGGGYGNEVTPEGLKGFKENLAEAERVLKEAELLAEKDPHLYTEWLETGMGLDYKHDQEETLFEKGVALAPDYYPLYDAMATYLAPRWHGKGRDLEDFFKRAWDKSKGVCGDALYAALVSEHVNEYNCNYVGSGEMAEWDGIDRGFQQALAEFPESNRYLNKYCEMACMFEKRELAAGLFEKIGDKVDSGVWGEKEDSIYRPYHRWATMDNQPFPCEDRRTTPFGVSPSAFRRYLLMGSAGLIGLSLLATLFIVLFFGVKVMRQPKQ